MLQIFEFRDFKGKIQRTRLLAVSFWLLAFSCQLSAVSYQRSDRPDRVGRFASRSLAGRFPLPLRPWMAGSLFDLVGLPQRFIGFGSFLCHAYSFPLARADCQPS